MRGVGGSIFIYLVQTVRLVPLSISDRFPPADMLVFVAFLRAILIRNANDNIHEIIRIMIITILLVLVLLLLLLLPLLLTTYY